MICEGGPNSPDFHQQLPVNGKDFSLPFGKQHSPSDPSSATSLKLLFRGIISAAEEPAPRAVLSGRQATIITDYV